MAKVTKITEKGLQELTVKGGNYLLELTPEEAVTIYRIMAHIGGYPETTPRGHADKVHAAFTHINDVYLSNNYTKLRAYMSGAVTFRNVTL